MYTLDDVMKRLDATANEVWKFIDQGRLPAGVCGEWNESDVDALAEQLADEDADQQVDDALKAARVREQELAEDWKPSMSYEQINGRINRDKVDVRSSHYSYDFKGIRIDPYRILKEYGISDPCQQHAIKKLLRCGKSIKDTEQDITEVIETLQRWLEMIREEKI